MDEIKSPSVQAVFDNLPTEMRNKVLFLRQLIYETASEMDEVKRIDESLKWGEPSYASNVGSPIRINQKKHSDMYAMYFICSTSLISTFKELYSNTFTFEGDRAIVFNENDNVPIDELKHCIALALTYHKRKHLPLLGA